jgi:hypothetical protein
MFDLFNKIDQCIVCRHEYTSTHVETLPGLSIPVGEGIVNCVHPDSMVSGILLR